MSAHELDSPSSAGRVGLVLGGGGVGGLAFHAGTLLALHLDLGWDARDADVIVGTSAGSIVGTLLRAGVPPADMAAWASDATPTAAGTQFRSLMRVVDGMSPSRRLPLPAIPGRVSLGALAHRDQLIAAITSVLPGGVVDHADRFEIISPLLRSWPTQPLWISTVRVGDGRLTWFGPRADDTPFRPGATFDVHGDGNGDESGYDAVTPTQAVAASCAIPLLSRPVRLGRHRYVDGGVRSPTNADVLTGRDLDLVLVVSPMGQPADGPNRSPVRRVAQRRLDRELRILRNHDVPVQVISPDLATAEAMGWNLLERSNTAAVMRGALLGATPGMDPATMAMLRRRRTDVLV